jgi:hypothetical protein
MAIDWEVMRQYRICLDDGDAQAAIQLISEKLRALPAGPFHLALELEITNAPANVAAWLQSCLAAAREVAPVRAAYVQLNGFEINTDLWFFSFYAFPEDPGTDDAGRLESWHWCSNDCLAIEGLEPLQRIFAEHGPDIRSDAGFYAAQLVLFKFFALIKAATALLTTRDFPVMAGVVDGDDKLVIP